MTKTNLSERLAAAALHSKAQIATAPAPEVFPAVWPPKKVKAVKPPRVQFLVRLTADARLRVHEAAQALGISEQELIERYAMTLPATLN